MTVIYFAVVVLSWVVLLLAELPPVSVFSFQVSWGLVIFYLPEGQPGLVQEATGQGSKRVSRSVHGLWRPELA